MLMRSIFQDFEQPCSIIWSCQGARGNVGNDFREIRCLNIVSLVWPLHTLTLFSPPHPSLQHPRPALDAFIAPSRTPTDLVSNGERPNVSTGHCDRRPPYWARFMTHEIYVRTKESPTFTSCAITTAKSTGPNFQSEEGEEVRVIFPPGKI